MNSHDLIFLSHWQLQIVSGSIEDLAAAIPELLASPYTTLFQLEARNEVAYYLLEQDHLERMLPFHGDPEAIKPRIDVLTPLKITGDVSDHEQSAIVLDHGSIQGVWTESPAKRPRGVRRGRGRGRGATGADSDQSRITSPDIPRTRFEGEPTDPTDKSFRRTPHLEAPAALPKSAGDVITVRVRTDAASMDENEDGEDVVIEAPGDVERVHVEVELVMSSHFRAIGESHSSLTISRDTPESESISFQLEISDEAPARPAGLLALFTYRGRPCGHVSRVWDWATDSREAPALPGHAIAAASLPVHIDSMRPDLSVFVTAPSGDDGMHFACGVQTPLLSKYSTTVTADYNLSLRAADFVSSRIRRLFDVDLPAADRRNRLEEVGYEFWKASPPTFQEAFWELIDAGTLPKHIYIASQEATLPWELMIPHRTVNGLFEARKPLGVEFAMGRWTRADTSSPPQRIPVRQSAVVAPRYDEKRTLPYARAEADFVEEHLNGTIVSPATIQNLDSYFGSSSASLIHFVCHGTTNVEDDDAVYLDHDEELRSTSLLRLRGFRSLCRSRAPFVFINACDSGRLTPSLVGGAGFPLAFSELGARAILAPLWSVDDKQAHQIALTLYTAALSQGAQPVAEILREIRARAYDEDEADTYAAYVFYGDPLATLTLLPS